MTRRRKTATKPRILESAFQKQVLAYATLTGWRTAHFRTAQNASGDYRTPVAGDGKGFPDLVLVRDRVLFIELKSATGSLSKQQIEWRDALLAAGAEWHMWRPDDWTLVVAALSRSSAKKPGSDR